MKQYIVGAYAASPSLNSWNPDLETRFMAALREMPSIRGLEVPFYGTLHRHDEVHFLKNLRPEWDHVLTLIPGTMDQLKIDPEFGLASNSARGRKAALDFAETARRELTRFNRRMGRRSFLAVEVHSAPTQFPGTDRSSADAFAKSLSEIASWDWDGAMILVEHCDAFVAGQTPAKGFLPLSAEVEIVRGLASMPAPIGLLINWGRSAIEGRSTDRALEHVEFAKKSGVLKGLIFSGCADQHPHHGGWQDSHAPFGSLLTPARAAECMAAAGPSSLIALGFKMQPLPFETSLQDRINLIKETLEIIDECAYQNH